MISKTRFLLLFITLQHRILRCIHCGQNIYDGAQTFTSPTLHKNTLLALQIKAIALSLSEMHSFVQQPIFSQVVRIALRIICISSDPLASTTIILLLYLLNYNNIHCRHLFLTQQPNRHTTQQHSLRPPLSISSTLSRSLELAAEEWSFPAIP